MTAASARPPAQARRTLATGFAEQFALHWFRGMLVIIGVLRPILRERGRR